jgi:septal ring factor EnvC (AmiA/AmiB activator)
VSKFGRHKHPELQYIEVNNNGIDIELLSSNTARVIFDGTVSAIFQQPGYNSIVMVRHGSYISVYCNLANISVRSGQEIKAGDIIGDVAVAAGGGNPRMLFQLRKEKKTLDPAQWLMM